VRSKTAQKKVACPSCLRRWKAKTMEMRIYGWMIWMAMLMNVVEAEQEDEVDHTGRCQ